MSADLAAPVALRKAAPASEFYPQIPHCARPFEPNIDKDPRPSRFVILSEVVVRKANDQRSRRTPRLWTWQRRWREFSLGSFVETPFQDSSCSSLIRAPSTPQAASLRDAVAALSMTPLRLSPQQISSVHNTANGS